MPKRSFFDALAATDTTREQLRDDLIALRDEIGTPIDGPANFYQKQMIYQNIGGFMMRAGRLDALIRELSQ